MADSRRPRRRSLRRLRTTLFGVNALVLTGVVLAAYGIGVLDQPERDTLDTRFEVRGSEGAPSDVVVVAIDDVTFDELDRPVALPPLAARPGHRPPAPRRRQGDRLRHPVHRADAAA